VRCLQVVRCGQKRFHFIPRRQEVSAASSVQLFHEESQFDAFLVIHSNTTLHNHFQLMLFLSSVKGKGSRFV